MFETLQIVSLCISVGLNIITLVALCSGKVRDKIFKSRAQKQKEKEEEENRMETHKCLLRDALLTNYKAHKDAQEWTTDDYENFEHLYKQYKKLKGNSFVDKLWNKVQSWKVTM